MSLKQFLFAGSAALSIGCASAAPGEPLSSTQLDPATLARIDRDIASEYAKDARGGVVAALVIDGRIAWTKAVGWADEADKREARVDSVFPLASATKLVTGIMLLQLVERGTVHLADPVEKYVPEVRSMTNPFPWAPPITLMQLATMTAGVERGLSVRADLTAKVEAAPTWEEKFAALMPGLTIKYEPGTINRYSNTGYALLGLALSRAAKRPFAEYVTAEILEPLGMDESRFEVTPATSARVVRGYALDESPVVARKAPNSPTMYLLPAAGLLSTVRDLAKLMNFQMGNVPGKMLSPQTLSSSYELMLPTDANMRYGDGVGFAAVRDPDSRLVALGHGGAFWEGFNASYEFDGATKTGVIFLANTYAGKANYKTLARKILAFLNPDSAGGSGLKPFEEH